MTATDLSFMSTPTELEPSRVDLLRASVRGVEVVIERTRDNTFEALTNIDGERRRWKVGGISEQDARDAAACALSLRRNGVRGDKRGPAVYSSGSR